MKKKTSASPNPIRNTLFVYAPFGWLFLWGAPTVVKFVICLVVFLPLSYGFLGIADPFNVINYILVVPIYFAVGSTLVREFYKRVYDAMEIDHTLEPTAPIVTKLPSDALMLPVLLCLIVQLFYIYVDLGFGVTATSGKVPFEAFPVLFVQHWITQSFPIIFFIFYITVQFIALWFAIVVGLAMIDLMKWLIGFFHIRKSLFTNDAKYKEADIWIYNTNKAIGGIPWLAFALSLNGFTYRAQIKNLSTLNYDGFMLLAMALLLLSICVKVALMLTKEKYLSDHHDKDSNATPLRSRLSAIGLLVSVIARALPSWGMLAAALGIASNFPVLGSAERVRLAYTYMSPSIERLLEFVHY